ncbi:MAG: penicillin acylase family protein [Sphingomonadaceae bacterium]
MAHKAIPSTNFIYADAEGNIAYIYNAAIPDRKVGPDWRGILPGNDSSLIWQDLAPYESLPRYENPSSGYLWNANNTPFKAAGPDDLDPLDFPAELGIETKMTNRARRSERLLREANRIDRETLERIKYDTGWENEDYVKATLDGIAALDLSGQPVLKEAQQILSEWDFTSDGVGRADALALIVLRKPMGDSYNGRPLTPPREVLEFTADHLMTHFGKLDPPMQDILRLRQGPGPYAVDLPLDGGSDTLRASTLWDYDPDGKLSVRHGDSF